MTARTFTFQVTAQPPASNPRWLTNAITGGAQKYQWFEIGPEVGVTTTKLADCPPTYIDQREGGPGFKIAAWCGAALRREQSVLLIGAAGGHGDYHGNEVNALVLSQDNPRWVELCRRSAASDIIMAEFLDPGNVRRYNGVLFKDYRRQPTHNAYFTHFIQPDDRFVHVPGPGTGVDGDFAATDWAFYQTHTDWTDKHKSFSIMSSFKAVDWTAYNAANDWDAALFAADGGTPKTGFYPPKPYVYSSNVEYPGAVADPITGDLYCAGDAYPSLWKFTLASRTWTLLKNQNFAFYHNHLVMALDPFERGDGAGVKRILAIDAAGNYGIFLSSTGNTIAVTHDPNGLPWTALAKQAGDDNSGAVFDEHNNQYIVFLNNSSGGRLPYGYDIFTIKYVSGNQYLISEIQPQAATINGVASTIPDFMRLTYPGRAQTWGPLGKPQYVPALRGVVIADQYSYNVHFMRVD